MAQKIYLVLIITRYIQTRKSHQKKLKDFESCNPDLYQALKFHFCCLAFQKKCFFKKNVRIEKSIYFVPEKVLVTYFLEHEQSLLCTPNHFAIFGDCLLWQMKYYSSNCTLWKHVFSLNIRLLHHLMTIC